MFITVLRVHIYTHAHTHLEMDDGAVCIKASKKHLIKLSVLKDLINELLSNTLVPLLFSHSPNSTKQICAVLQCELKAFYKKEKNVEIGLAQKNRFFFLHQN